MKLARQSILKKQKINNSTNKWDEAKDILCVQQKLINASDLVEKTRNYYLNVLKVAIAFDNDRRFYKDKYPHLAKSKLKAIDEKLTEINHELEDQQNKFKTGLHLKIELDEAGIDLFDVARCLQEHN